MLVSVFIPCYNEQETIASLLDALRAQTFPATQMEVIIADGMSTDGTREVISQYTSQHPDLKILLVDNPKRMIPAGLNRAIAASSGDILVRVDAHSRPAPDYVERCINVLEATGAANVGGRWIIEPSQQTWIARGIAAAAAHPLGAGGARYRVNGEAGEVETVPFGSYPRAWMERIGGYDESLLTNEDYELNVRLRQAGGKIWFDPRIQSIYYARGNLKALWKQYARYGFWKVRMLVRYPDSLKWRQALPPAFVLLLTTLAVLSIIYPPVRWLLGVQLGIYLFVLLMAGIMEGHRRSMRMVPGFVLAIIVMHVAWGGAFLISAIETLFGGLFGSN